MRFAVALATIAVYATGALADYNGCYSATTSLIPDCCNHNDIACGILQFCGANYLTWACSNAGSAAEQYCHSGAMQCLDDHVV